MKLQAIAAVAILGTALSGCASVVEGSSEQISLNTAPVNGATCTVKNSRGEWTVTTPGDVTIKRSKTNANISCANDGYNTATTVAASDFDAWTLGNLVLGGIPGLVIDLSTGATNKYPKAVSVPMQPVSTGAAEAPRGPAAPPAKSNAAPTS